jgi:hypothetical protein
MIIKKDKNIEAKVTIIKLLFNAATDLIVVTKDSIEAINQINPTHI